MPEEVRYASIQEVDDMTVSLHSTAEIPATPEEPSMSFWDALHSFENQSLWKYFRCDEDGKWIHRGLMLGTLVIVHDGLYMPHVDKQVCSAAFMVYCTRTKLRAKGTVVVRCADADNYRAEIFGRLVV